MNWKIYNFLIWYAFKQIWRQITEWYHSWFGVTHTARKLNLGDINCISWIQFRSWLSPNGVTVFNFLIQKVSRVFSLSFSISLDVSSISWLKLCPVWLKCLPTGMALGSLSSFLWLFNCILKAFSAFPTYLILQSSHYSKYMMKLILQIVFWNILIVLLVWILLKCSVFITCLQQSILQFEKHVGHFPLVNLLLVSSFLFFLLCSPQSTFSGSCFCGKLTAAYFQITF